MRKLRKLRGGVQLQVDKGTRGLRELRGLRGLS